MALIDSFNRVVTDLRLSITSACNYHCVYCRPSKDVPAGELTWPEYLHIARLFVELGVRKIRVTGGEPLLRKGIVAFIRDLSRLSSLVGENVEITLTTNGHFLAPLATELKQAGLDRATVSLDSLDDSAFARITGERDGLSKVLAGIRAAVSAGLTPLKVNSVLIRGINDDQVERFIEFARREHVIVRFIEFMPLNAGRSWTRESVVSATEIIGRVAALHPIRELAGRGCQTARRFAFQDGAGEIGVITSISDQFCKKCGRVRVTADGKIRACLFGAFEHNLIGLLRAKASDAALNSMIRSALMMKEAGHRIGTQSLTAPNRSMISIGG